MKLAVDGITLSQHKYVVDLLQKTNMTQAKPVSTPTTTSKKLSKHDGTILLVLNLD